MSEIGLAVKELSAAIDYPVEIEPPDISQWRTGNAGVPFVHSFVADEAGPHLLITAVIHGNEPAGAVALTKLLSSNFRPSRGRLTLVFANVQAYASFSPSSPRESRWVEEDMNRVWSQNVLEAHVPRSSEVARARQLVPFLETADYLLDLHSTQHPNEPLVLAGPLERSRSLARFVGMADLVIIDSGHAQGKRMRDYGAFGDPARSNTALILECGQHWAASSSEVAFAGCLRMLERLRMLPPDGQTEAVELPGVATRFVEITLPVTIKKQFRFAMPLRGGEIIAKAGTVVGYDGDEEVVTSHDESIVIMPSQRLWAGLTAVRLGRFISAPPLPSI
jgi:succinylglutamate desuccinylase